MEHFTEDSRSLGGALKDHILNQDLVAISQIVSTDNVDHSLVQDGLRQCRHWTLCWNRPIPSLTESSSTY